MEEAFLTLEQQQALLHRAEELSNFVRTWKIGAEPVSAEEASERTESEPEKVYSVAMDWVVPSQDEISKLGFWISPGFDEDCDDFYIGEIDFVDSQSTIWPHTEIHFPCKKCKAWEGEPDVDCENCGGEGELIFDLSWDDDYRVIIDRG